MGADKSLFRWGECALCGKVFIRPPETIYKLVIKENNKPRKVYFCSYNCYRVAQKQKEENQNKTKEL